MANLQRFWAYSQAMAALRVMKKEEEEAKAMKPPRRYRVRRKPLG